MPRSPVTVLLCLSSFVVALSAAHAVPATIPVDEIESGMRGHGLTVFRGTTPERFEVEVIDVLHGFRPDQELILMRTEHPILDHARTVGGTSGSPIYLDGRLAGALAYSWPFGLDPVVGVTPIRNMLHEMSRPVRPGAFLGATLPGRSADASRAAVPPARPVISPYLGGEVDPAGDLRAYATRLGGSTDDQASQRMLPVTTPVMMAGFTREASSFIRELLSPLGMTPLQGGGVSGTSSAGDETGYVDGGAIGVQLIRGDISLTSIGTVTHVGPRRLIAFGHPMINAGQSGLPTCTARILHVLARRNRSFKIGEAVQPSGTLIHDRQSAIVIDQELRAGTVPVQIRVHGVEGSPRDHWNLEVANHRALTPALTLAALSNALGAIAADSTPVTYRVEATVEIEGVGSRTVVDGGYMPNGPVTASTLASLRVFRLITAALGNPFSPSFITGVNLNVYVSYGRGYAEILDASLPVDEVDPGATVELRVRERRYDQPVRTRLIPIQIPREAAGQTLSIRVEPGHRVRVPRPNPRDLEELIDGIIETYPSTSVIVSSRLPSRGLRFHGHTTSNLPGSALDALMPTNSNVTAEPFVTHARQEIPTDEVIRGSASLRVRVNQRARGR